MNNNRPVKLVRRPSRVLATATVDSAAGDLVAMPMPGAGLDHAARANFFHRLSREAGLVAIRAAIAAGVELLEAKAEYAGGFVNWVRTKCAFGVSTAYNYIALAEKTLPESTLPQLLALPEADRETAIEAAATSTDSRTLTDLYADLGIVKRTPSKMGGARPGAGRPKKSEQETTDPDLPAQQSLMEAGAALAELDRILGPGGGATLWKLAALRQIKKDLARLGERADALVASRLKGGC
jgi:hypothetical protein